MHIPAKSAALREMRNSRASYFQRDILAGFALGTDVPRKKLVRHETGDKNSKSSLPLSLSLGRVTRERRA